MIPGTFFSPDFPLPISGPHPLARLLDGPILHADDGEPAQPAGRRAVVLLAGDAGQQQRAEPRAYAFSSIAVNNQQGSPIVFSAPLVGLQ